jgi:ribosome maturation factor RimP
VEREALVLLLAGSLETLSVGVEKLRVIRDKQLQDYIANLDSIGVDRLPRVSKKLAELAEDPLMSGAGDMRPPTA